MSQKSSVPQAISFVSQVLKRDMRNGLVDPEALRDRVASEARRVYEGAPKS